MVIQQLTVAASTYLIIEAMANTTAGNMPVALRYLALFGLSLIAVYLPNALAELYSDRWGLASFGRFLADFADCNQSKVTLFHQSARKAYESWLTHEAEKTYKESTTLLTHLLGTVLNALFNIAVIGIMISSEILVWYLAAGVVMLIANRLSKDVVKDRSLTVQDARRGLASIVLTAWDNITSGNRHNRETWRQQKTAALAGSIAALDRYNITKALISSGTVVLAFLLVCFGIGRYIFDHLDDVERLSAMIVTIPRQIQIIQSIFMFFGLYLAWVGSFERLKSLSTAIDIPSRKAQTKGFIDWPSLRFEGQAQLSAVASFDALLTQLNQMSHGRITLRGRNGAGKSALLATIAEETGASSMYIPSSPRNLQFTAGVKDSSSDGEFMMAIFKQIPQLGGVQYLLLDEWDANLDQANSDIISAQLDQLAEDRVVLEIRHRT